VLAIDAGSAYIAGMFFQGNTSIWRDVSPTGAVQDFVEMWKGNPYRWRTLAAAIAMTTGMLIIAIPATQRAEPRHPDIIYISTFDEGRTRAEIEASNIAHQKAEDKIRAARKQVEDEKLKLAEDLGRATFIDVDKFKKEREANEAAQKKADAKAVARNMARLKEQQGAAGE
jgi:hypothetical protein